MRGAQPSVAINKAQAHAADRDDVAVAQARRADDGFAIYSWHPVAQSEEVTIFVLVDLSGNVGREPPAQLHAGHIRFTDHGEAVAQLIFLAVGAAAENNERGYMHPAGRNLRAFAEFGGH